MLAESALASDEADLVSSLIDSVDRYARDRIDARGIDRAHQIAPSVLRDLAEIGLFGLSIPERWGGAGLSMRAIADVTTALARHDRSVATTVGLHLGLGTRGLVAFGSEAQHERWLPDLAAGDSIAAFATTEPDAGSDLAAIRTRALLRDGALHVDGGKVFVTNGGFADLYTITASTPGLGGARRGHGLLVLERGDPGVRAGAEEDKLGLRGSSTTTLHLDGVVVPKDRLIGPPGEGMAQLAHVLAWGRTLMAAGCIGTAEAAISAATFHTSERKQFGKALDRFEVVQDQLADMAALRFAMVALVRDVTALEHDPAALLARSVAVKVLCSEAAWEIADVAVQLHGGSGFVEETGVALLLRDARITRIFEGANDVLRIHLGLTEATNPREPASLAAHGPIGLEADAFVARIKSFRTALTSTHGVRLLGKQRLLHRLGQLVVLRDAVHAAVRHASDDPDRAARWLSLARQRSLVLLEAS